MSNVFQRACRQIPPSGTAGWDVARSTREGEGGGQIALTEAVSSSPPTTKVVPAFACPLSALPALCFIKLCELCQSDI